MKEEEEDEKLQLGRKTQEKVLEEEEEDEKLQLGRKTQEKVLEEEEEDEKLQLGRKTLILIPSPSTTLLSPFFISLHFCVFSRFIGKLTPNNKGKQASEINNKMMY